MLVGCRNKECAVNDAGRWCGREDVWQAKTCRDRIKPKRKGLRKKL